MAVKLDISKACDRVEWEFLQWIMQKIGLLDQWVNLAMETVCTASYSTIINEEPGGFITPAHRIKQEDPLSPYLFLLCAEGFSSLIWRAVDSHLLKGVMSWHGVVRISHLLFSNDSLLFCEATTKECRNLMNILAMYERASGQAINRQKTTLLFSPNTKHPVKLGIRNMLSAQIMTSCEVSWLTNGEREVQGEHFQGGAGASNKKNDGMEGNHISKADRYVLIKTVV